MNGLEVLAVALAGAAILSLAALLGAFRALGRERTRSAELDRKLAAAEERARNFEDSQASMGEFLRAQAAESARSVANELVTRANETFKAQEEQTKLRLEAQLKPVAETLAKFEQQVQAIETKRAEDTGGLKEQIGALMRASNETQFEARKLSVALRRGAGIQGRWGEQVLRNVLELAGLQRHFDFQEQVSTEAGEGRLRPDVVVNLPGGGKLVIDAKVSLNAFLEAQDCIDEPSREACLARYIQSVGDHVKALSAKAYWDQFEPSPDFVAMFVPGEGFLATALERHPELLNDAMKRRVVIVSPSTLFALCKAVAYGWRVEEQARGAAKVADLGRELYKRLSVMGGHAASLGKALEAAVNRYNGLVGSLESQVMTQARRFEDLSADHEGKELPELAPVETAVRPLAKLAGSASAAVDASEAAAE
jgi:DNA recombination protein RmuC